MPDDIRLDPQRPPVRLGILISGDARHCLAIASAIRSGLLPGCEIAVVISNITGAPGIDAARADGQPVVVLEGRGRDPRDHEDAVSALLRTYRVDLVCLAGYLRALSSRFVRGWRGQVLSIHPSLLPAFPGHHAAEQALGYGVQYTGCTVYFVEEAVDAGVIVVQRVVSVKEGDTAEVLAERISTEEAAAYPEAIRRVLNGQYETEGRRYVLREDLRVPQDAAESQSITAVEKLVTEAVISA